MELQKRLLSLFALVLMVATMASAASITFQTVTGTWSNPTPLEGAEVVCTNGFPMSTIEWGDPVGTEQSAYDFEANVPGGIVIPPSPTGWVLLGDFTHHNWPIYQPWLTSVNLALNIGLSVNAVPQSALVFNYAITHEETPNISGTCEYPGGPPCSDHVLIIGPGSETFDVNGVEYTLELMFSTGGVPTNPVSSFITFEGQENTAQIFGRFSTPQSDVVIPEPGTYALMLVGLGLLALARRKKQG